MTMRAAVGRGLSVALVALVGLGAAACSPEENLRGHVPDAEALSEIKPGVQTRDDVVEILGSPSAVATFDDQHWYYITRKTEDLAFYSSDVIEQQVFVVEFNEGGFVKQVAWIDESQARDIDLVDRETPTKGKKLTFLEQLIGNLGAIPGSTR